MMKEVETSNFFVIYVDELSKLTAGLLWLAYRPGDDGTCKWYVETGTKLKHRYR